MKKIIIGIITLLSFSQAFSQANDTTKYIYYPFTYGNALDRYYAKHVLMIPRDTVWSKDGVAQKGGTFYIGNGTSWSQITGTGGTTDTLQFITWLRLYNVIDSLKIVNDARYKLKTDSSGASGYVTHSQEDTAKTNLRNSIAGKKDKSDSTAATGYRSNGTADKVRDSLAALIAGKVTNSGGAKFLGSGTYAAKPLANTGPGLYYATPDSNRFYYSDGTTWTPITDKANQLFNLYVRKDGGRGINIARGADTSFYFKGLVDSGAFHLYLNPDSTITGYVAISGAVSDSGIAVTNGILATRSGSAPFRLLQVDSIAYQTRARGLKLVDSMKTANDLRYLQTVNTTNSITGNGTAGTPVKLVNDVATPGFNQRYGARWDGTKGYEFEGTDYVNILNFGADSTGGVDISTAVINALALGKPVYIPSGTWKWTAQVNVPEGSTIFGAFRYTKIKMSGNGYAALKLARRCNIANLTFTGTYGTGGDSSQIAVLIDSTNESIVQNNVFDSVGIGVAATKNGLEAGANFFSRGNVITRNISAGCLYGIALRYRAEYNIVSENICNTNTIGIYQVGGNNLIRNNNVNSNVTGIYVSGWDNPNNNNGHNGIEGNAVNHNTYAIWLDSVTLGCRVLGNMMYFGEIHLRKCSNVTFESNDLSNNTIAGEANSFCIFQHNRIRIVTYNLNINGYDNMYFTNNLYEGSSFFPLDIRIPNGSGGLAIKTQFDTSLVSLNLSGQFLTEYPTSLGIADSYLKQGSGTSSPTDFLPWIQSKAHTGTGWGLLISPTVGSDANAAYYSAVVSINSATTVSTIPLLKINNNLTTKFSVGPDGKTAIGSDSRVAWLSLPAGVATAGGAPIQFIAGPPTTTPVAGQLQYNTGVWIADSSASVRDTFATRSWARNNITGGGGAASSVIFAQTAAGTAVTNTTSLTSIFGTGVGSRTIAANALTVGKTIVIHGWVTISTDASAQTFNLYTAPNSNSATSAALAMSLPGSMAGQLAEITVNVTVLTTGSSGTASSYGTLKLWGATGEFMQTAMNNLTINTTGSLNFDLLAGWTTASTSNIITSQPQFRLEVK